MNAFLRRLYTVTKRTKGSDKGGCRNNDGIQPYKKAVSEQRERLVGGKIQPFKKAVSEQRRGKSASCRYFGWPIKWPHYEKLSFPSVTDGERR